jgi:hypothetical protein
MATANVTRRAGKRGPKTTKRTAESRLFWLQGDDQPVIPIATLPPAALCPFCGADTPGMYIGTEVDTYKDAHAFVECRVCGARGPVHSASSEGGDATSLGVAKEAAAAWNKRGVR